MSRYVVLIRADIHAASVNDIHAITVSSNPETGLAILQSYCPVNLALIHAIESASRTDDLERTLHIKYQIQRLRPRDFWFRLTAVDVDFIKTINAANLMRVTGLIKRELKPPVIPKAELPGFIQEQLDLCQSLLNNK